MKDLLDKVIVITGASSGIGRATALMAAKQHATVVLVARHGETLREVAGECQEAGGRAIAAPADVTDPEALRKIAKSAYRQFGHVDAWVNNAAVSLFAKFETAPPEDYRRVIETNLYGYMNGARAVLPYFREQGEGILINVSSMVGKTGTPYVSAYTTSKFAINGWSESLRMELMDEPDIHVCTVLPASIDTPIFQHAANYTGRAIKPLPPVYPPEVVAETILDCLEKPRPEVFAGKSGGLLAAVRSVLPRATAEKMMARQVDKEHFQENAAGPTDGNLYSTMPDSDAITGGWREDDSADRESKRKIAWTAAAAAAGIAAAVAGYAWSRSQTPIQKAKERIEPSIRRTATRVMRSRGLVDDPNLINDPDEETRTSPAPPTHFQ